MEKVYKKIKKKCQSWWALFTTAGSLHNSGKGVWTERTTLNPPSLGKEAETT